MKRTITALLTAATLTVAAAPSVSAMDNEINAFVGAVYKSLNSMQMDLAMIEDLTVRDVRQIQSIMHGGDSEGEKRSAINNILRKAGERG